MLYCHSFVTVNLTVNRLKISTVNMQSLLTDKCIFSVCQYNSILSFSYSILTVNNREIDSKVPEGRDWEVQCSFCSSCILEAIITHWYV